VTHIADLLAFGFGALTEYLSAHVLACLVPAFFIAGAIYVFVSKEQVVRYFGPSANKFVSYGIASISGTILAVCSCTVLPLFAGIYRRGAGLGPAIAFLYSGPAVNVLAIVYTAKLLGFDLGLARAVGAIVFSVVIGLAMAALFYRSERQRTSDNRDVFAEMAEAAAGDAESERRKLVRNLVFFALWVVVLVFAARAGSSLAALQRVEFWIALAALALIIIELAIWFRRDEVLEWLSGTWYFVKLITPWLLGGVFVAGIVRGYLPAEVVGRFLGGGGIGANALASVIGALMYFATLTEVPIIKALTEVGMGRGPALALLLAGPALSLPNMLVIASVTGWKRALTYIALVVVAATVTGFLLGPALA